MNAHADKTQENKSQSVANAVSQKQGGGESTFQFVDNRPEAVAQRKLQEMANNSPRVKQAAQLQAMADNYSAQQQQPIQKIVNKTGLPDNLKTGIENLSGYSMDDVKVHYNSDKPAQLQAHAYAQGTDIHLASGQEQHLPHEAWHVVQQKQGRVKPTMQMKGEVNINDDAGLETEADLMGAKSLQQGELSDKPEAIQNYSATSSRVTIQRLKRHTRQEDGSLGPPVTNIDIATLDETEVLPLLANIDIYGAIGIPDGSNLEFEAGDKAILEARRDHPTFGNISALTLSQLITDPSPILNAASKGLLDKTTAGRQIAGAFPNFITTFQTVQASPRVRGFGQWAASKIVTARQLLNCSAEAANQLLDYMSELREVEIRIPELSDGETINIAEQSIPGVAAQTADVSMSHGKQIEVKTVRELILNSRPVLHQLSDAVQKFHNAELSQGPYEAVIYASYSPPQARVTGRGVARGTTTNSVNMANGDFVEDFVPDAPGGRPASNRVIENLRNEVLNWLRNSRVNGTDTVDYVRIRIENSTGPAFNFQRDLVAGWRII